MSRDGFTGSLGLEVVRSDEGDEAEAALEAGDDHLNPHGTVHGGVIATLVDSAMGAASVTFAKDRKVFSSNAEMKVSFLKPARIGSVLTATAYTVSGGKRAAFIECEVTDDDERLVAKASSTYLLTPRE